LGALGPLGPLGALGPEPVFPVPPDVPVFPVPAADGCGVRRTDDAALEPAFGLPAYAPPLRFAIVASTCDWRSFACFIKSVAACCEPVTIDCSFCAPVRAGLKSGIAAAACPSACSSAVLGVGAARMLLISGWRFVNEFG